MLSHLEGVHAELADTQHDKCAQRDEKKSNVQLIRHGMRPILLREVNRFLPAILAWSCRSLSIVPAWLGYR